MAVRVLRERVADVSKNHLAGHRAQVGTRSLSILRPVLEPARVHSMAYRYYPR